ncbi:MAG: hypothetical protein ACN6PV_27945 [Achromobacter sp.]|jgi:hypothetical protein|uniref:hypothetical protein n=1 Tax=Achromobacter sp. TaxID=134375 RepID=UPI003D0273DE
MIRTFYFVWNSVTLPYRVKPESSKRVQESLRKRKEGRRRAWGGAQSKKPATLRCAGFAGRIGKNWQAELTALRMLLLVGATGVEPVTYAL